MEKTKKVLLITLLLIFSVVMTSCASRQKTNFSPVAKDAPNIRKTMYLKSGRIIQCDILWEGMASEICCKRSGAAAGMVVSHRINDQAFIISYSAGEVDLISTFGESRAEEIAKRYERRKKYRELKEQEERIKRAQLLPNLEITLSQLYDQGRYADAIPIAEEILVIKEETLGPEHSDVAKTLYTLAMLYNILGDYTEAEPLYRRSLAINEKAVGPEHPEVASILNSLAGLYIDLGDYAKAKPLSKRSLAIREKILGSNHPDVAESLNNLAVIYTSLGDHDKAEPLYKRALKIYEKAVGPTE